MDNQHIPFGAICADKVTKFEGTVTAYCRHLTGCDQVLIKGKSIKDKPGKGSWVDHARVEVKGDDPVVAQIAKDCPFSRPELELGIVVQHVVTGHRGTIISVAEHAGHNCREYYLVPLQRDDNEQSATWYADAFLAIVDEEEKVEPEEVQDEKRPGPDNEAMASARVD